MSLLLREAFFLAEIKNIKLGNIQVDKLYCGTDLVFEKAPIDTTAPVTTVYPDPQYAYDAGTLFWLEVNEACNTYYTLDGSTPTTASTLFVEAFALNANTTIKYFSVDVAGNVEAVKTTAITINAPVTGWRYVRYIGHGDQTGVTTRLVELQALEGATNRLLNKTPINAYTPVNGGAIGVATNGAKVHATGYPLWWVAEGVPELIYDLGALYPIDTINVTGYSPTADPRTTQFKVYVSKNNVDWTQVIDYSANATMQPEAGFNFPVPS